MNLRPLGLLTAVIAVGSSAVLGVIFGPFKSGISEPIPCVVFAPKISSALERLESVNMASLNGGVGLVKELVPTGDDYGTVGIRLDNIQTTFGVAVRRSATAKNLAFGIGKLGGFLDSNASAPVLTAHSSEVPSTASDKGDEKSGKDTPECEWWDAQHWKTGLWFLLVSIGAGFSISRFIFDVVTSLMTPNL